MTELCSGHWDDAEGIPVPLGLREIKEGFLEEVHLEFLGGWIEVCQTMRGKLRIYGSLSTLGKCLLNCAWLWYNFILGLLASIMATLKAPGAIFLFFLFFFFCSPEIEKCISRRSPRFILASLRIQLSDVRKSGKEQRHTCQSLLGWSIIPSARINGDSAYYPVFSSFQIFALYWNTCPSSLSINITA